METPPLKRRISVPDATVTENDRIALADYLATIKHDNELFMRCVRKCIKKLHNYQKADVIWIRHWLPIIEKELRND